MQAVILVLDCNKRTRQPNLGCLFRVIIYKEVIIQGGLLWIN